MIMREVTVIPNFGKHCFVAALDISTVVKVFHYKPSDNWEDLESFRWGDKPKQGEPDMSVSLVDATKIQNIAAMHGLAPKVTEIVKVRVGDRKYWGQIQQDLGNAIAPTQEQAEKIYREVVKLGETYGFSTEKEDVSVFDVIDNKLIDFNTFHFNADHKEKFKEFYLKNAIYGKTHYHPVEEWGITSSPRDNNKRVDWLRLTEANLRGASVLDLGCAGGWFTRYAYKMGAKRVVGIDSALDIPTSAITLAAQLVATDLEMWGIEYLDMDIEHNRPKQGMEKFDVVLFLSESYHVGVPEWLPLVTGGVCIVEDNSKDKQDTFKKLRALFRKVELRGHSEDRDNSHLPIYWCYT